MESTPTVANRTVDTRITAEVSEFSKQALLDVDRVTSRETCFGSKRVSKLPLDCLIA